METGTERGAVVRLSLERPPVVVHCGIGIHGATPVEKYRQLGFWCLHLYRYTARLRVDGNWYEITPGTVSLVAPESELEYRFTARAVHAFAHFRLPRARGERVAVPVVQRLGETFDGALARLQQVIGAFPAAPRQAEARLWDLLLELAGPPGRGQKGAVHPALQKTLERIELRLGQPIDIGELAREADVSHNHLIRLFRAATGTTVAGYIARRRVECACHLLTGTTLPIKAIARQVGIPDLQHFNKVIRKHRVMGPRAIRGAGVRTSKPAGQS